MAMTLVSGSSKKYSNNSVSSTSHLLPMEQALARPRLMAQAGLHIPASPDSSLPVFGGVYADIGDEQSIARDLSTFSAHVSRLTTILAAANGSSLVLMDEIGAGTDPGEGAALGNAILEALARRGAHVVATTHLDGIKAFVAQDPAMVNGAVEFDLDRMRPVYKLHIGFPGRSFAIDVACRLGIPPSIVQRAREFVGDSGAGVAALLDQLHVLESQRAEQVASAARERAEAARAREEAENIVGDLRAKAASLRARTGQVVAEIAAEARRRVEAVVEDLKRGRAVQEARHAVGKLAELARGPAGGISGGDRRRPRMSRRSGSSRASRSGSGILGKSVRWSRRSAPRGWWRCSYPWGRPVCP